MARDLGRTSPWRRDMPQFSNLNLANNRNSNVANIAILQKEFKIIAVHATRNFLAIAQVENFKVYLVPAAEACLDMGETLLPT